MKKISVLLIMVFVAIGLHAQTNSKQKNISFDILFGFGKVGILENDNFIYSLGNSVKYESEYIVKKGNEADLRISSNWSIKEKNEIILGLNLNIWGRKSLVTNGDIIANWQEEAELNQTVSSQFNLIVGYRYLFVHQEKLNIFVEGVLQKKIFSGKFPGVNFSIEPGIGAKYNISEHYNLITLISYKKPLGNSVFNQVFQNRIGFKLGINMLM